jgi:hypothetical protein
LLSILQLSLSLIDDFTPRRFSDFEAPFGKLRSLNCAFAHGLRASFRRPELLFHSTKKFGSLKHEVQHRPAGITWQGPSETQQTPPSACAGAELFSQLPCSEVGCQYNRRRNRDGSSTWKLAIGVLTQPGSNLEIRARNQEVRFALKNGLHQVSLPGPKSAKALNRCAIAR